MKNNSLKILGEISLNSLIIFILRYIKVHVFYPRDGIVYNDVCQLYFGGLTIEDSIDIAAISMYFALIMMMVLVVNCQLLFGVASNDYMFLCRAGSRERLFRIIAIEGIRNCVMILLVNYVLYLVAEHKLPDVTDLYIVFSELVLTIILFLLSVVFIDKTGHSESYIIVFGTLLLFITLTGVIYEKIGSLPEYWGWFGIPYLIYDYSNMLGYSYEFDGVVYENTSYIVWGSSTLIQFGSVSVIALVVYILCERIFSIKK